MARQLCSVRACSYMLWKTTCGGVDQKSNESADYNMLNQSCALVDGQLKLRMLMRGHVLRVAQFLSQKNEFLIDLS